MGGQAWTLADAERWLLGLELFGMNFGLERVRALMGELGHPEREFRAVHVVGSNGKSSTARMLAAIAHEHGLRSGAFLSPHLVSFAERVLVDGRDVGPGDFAAAAERAHAAAGRVDAGLPGGERVTQFEAVTATAFSALAEARVEVAAIEAGLGGRYDATNVLAAPVVVLTSVGLEHTRWLGDTIEQIAGEKLAVVADGATLVVGERLHADAVRVAERVCRERGARLVRAPADTGLQLAAAGGFQRQNFALAREGARALLGELDDAAVARAASGTAVPGRFEVVDERPVTVFDGAHNPEGMQALAAALPAFVAGRRLVACVSVLDDKDAGAMLAALAPLCEEVVVTEARNPRALAADALAAAMPAGGAPARVVRRPHEALGVARERAGEAGVVIVAGSLYLLADLLRPEDAPRGSVL